MTNLTLSIPKKLKEEMEEFPEINWSEVARDSIKKKIAQLNFLKGLRIDSELTPQEALNLGKEVNKLLLKHYKS
ncbi:MAG: hypothetical protein BAJALOKI2v1_1110008 [Promethearchaeota archaeon]|nr:MAG: hypothetical protein BAJALOKI2v1_1110008 [Candidatus Lokiarchaeota archaeon]